MADKYTIKVQPKVDNSDAQKMEHDLSRRFLNVSKKFGHGLNNALKSSAKFGANALKGGLIGVAVAAAGALLTNPFEKVNEDINQISEGWDNIATRAGQYGVSIAKLRRAEEVFGAFGIKDLDTILARFETFREKARTGEDKSLQNYIQPNQDTIDALVDFSTNLRAMAPDQRNAASGQIFGEKFGNKIAEVLQEDLIRKSKQFNRYTAEQINRVGSQVAAAEEVQATNRQKLRTQELMQKGSMITKGTMKTQNEYERQKLAVELKQLSQYEIYAEQKILQEKALVAFEDMKATLIDKITPILEQIPIYADKAFRGFDNIVAAIKKLKFWGT
jgi:gas vesicle protein